VDAGAVPFELCSGFGGIHGIDDEEEEEKEEEEEEEVSLEASGDLANVRLDHRFILWE
jgi:hypothetical protein